MTKIILITGASGSGKTTISKYLAEKYKVFHFDEIGVPLSEEMIAEFGSLEGWQKWATERWIKKLLNLEGEETVIFEGSFNPEFASYYNKLICFDTKKDIRERRLLECRCQSELVTQDMENFSNYLKEKTVKLGGTVIDSSGDIHDTVKACLSVIEGSDSLRVDIPIEVVKNLVKAQFPKYAQLTIEMIEFSGWDNATFRLGDDMIIRLPRGEAYALKVFKEQAVLKELGKHLSIAIPVPIAVGKPGKEYKWNWSIYRYLEGDSANSLSLSDETLENISLDLTKFLRELHQIDTKNAPMPGLHNHWGGEHISIYECGALKYFEQLRGIIDADKAILLWQKAVNTKWEKPLVWIHGDLSAGNFLIKDGKLSAVIDFGGCACGDPARDLTIAYSFFKGRSRKIFKQELKLDEGTWLRAKAWALWKAAFELTNMDNKYQEKAKEQIRICTEILAE